MSVYTIGTIAAVFVVMAVVLFLAIGMPTQWRKDERAFKESLAEPAPEGFRWRYFDTHRFACCDDCKALVAYRDAETHLAWHASIPTRQPFAS